MIYRVTILYRKIRLGCAMLWWNIKSCKTITNLSKKAKLKFEIKWWLMLYMSLIVAILLNPIEHHANDEENSSVSGINKLRFHTSDLRNVVSRIIGLISLKRRWKKGNKFRVIRLVNSESARKGIESNKLINMAMPRRIHCLYDYNWIKLDLQEFSQEQKRSFYN
jgi:hypothetical protein